MLEMWVRSLGWEDPLEKEITTHSSILAWKVPCTGEPSRPQSMGLQRVKCDWVTTGRAHTLFYAFIHNFLPQPSRRSVGSLGLLSKHSLIKSSLIDFANSLRSQNTSNFIENSLNTQLPAFISLSLQDLQSTLQYDFQAWNIQLLT